LDAETPCNLGDCHRSRWLLHEEEVDTNARLVANLRNQKRQGGVRGFGGFEKRLLLASALGIVLQPFLGVIRTTAKLRHDFAHGVIESVDDERTAAIRGTLMEFLDDDQFVAHLKQASPREMVKASLMVARSVIRATPKAS
jgi:hypothetical protein